MAAAAAAGGWDESVMSCFRNAPTGMRGSVLNISSAVLGITSDIREDHAATAVQVRAFNLYVNLSRAWFLNYG